MSDRVPARRDGGVLDGEKNGIQGLLRRAFISVTDFVENFLGKFSARWKSTGWGFFVEAQRWHGGMRGLGTDCPQDGLEQVVPATGGCV
jgi:hypothetical protein